MATQVNYVDIDTRSSNLPLVSSAKVVSASYRDRTSVNGGTALGVRQPSLYYCENVLPTKTGLKAIDTLTYASAGELVMTDAFFLEEFTLTDANNVPAVAILVGTKTNTSTELKLFTYNPASSNIPSPKLVTSVSFPVIPNTKTKYHATHNVVNGVSILSINARYTTNSGIRRSFTQVLEVVSNTVSPSVVDDITTTLVLNTNNTDPANVNKKESDVIIGLLHNNGYLLAYTTLSLAWSSPSDIFNFTPSLIAGAGAGSITGVVGRIVTLVSTEIGFNVYCTGGVISARVSSNTSYPFTFKLLTHDIGVSDSQQVTEGTTQFVLSSAGLLSVGTSISKVAGDIADFLSAGRYDEYENGRIISNQLSEPLATRISFIGARYICISYKPANDSYFKYVLVYDTVLDAYGKIKQDHVLVHSINLDILGDFLSYNELSGTYSDLDSLAYQALRSLGVNDAAQVGYTLGIIDTTGALLVVSPTLENNTAKGVAIFGKFSIKENVQTLLDGVFVETVPDTKTFSINVLTSYAGTGHSTTTTPYEIVHGDTREYKCRLTGNTHSVVCLGAFELNRLSIGIRGVGYR